MGRVSCWLVLAVVALAVAPAAGAQTFTLNEALALAYTNNPQIEAARANARARDEDVAAAKGSWRPSVNASGSYGVQRTDISGPTHTLTNSPVQGRLSISQSVLSGGQNTAAVSHAIAQVWAARAQLSQAEQKILLATVTAYMDVVRDADIVHLHEEDVNVLRRQLEATQTQFDSGASTKTDLQETQARLAASQAALAQSRAQLNQSRNAFARMIGRPAETLQTMPGLPVLPHSEDQALQFALRDNPNLLEAKANDRAAEFATDYAVGALLPHASITAQYDYSKNSLSSGFGVNAQVESATVLGQVSIPIYQGGGEEARVRSAKEQQQQTRQGVIDAMQAATQSVHDSWAFLDASKMTMNYNQQRVSAAEGALAGVTEEQRGGERSILDILNAEEERLSAQISLVTSRHDTVVATFQVLSSSGQLTAKYLRLKVNLYDPKEHYDEDSGKWFGFGD